MAIQRVFLGWDRPPLASAMEFLLQRFGTRDRLDLHRLILVVPGARAGRRLQEMLVESAENEGLLLRPPKVVTVGQLPEQLYVAKRPFADDLVQQLAWVRALGQVEPQELKLLAASVPAADDLAGWLGLGAMLGRLHRELAAEALDFKQVAEQGAALDGFCEEPRWRMLAAVQDRYLRVLDGVDLWDRQTARLFAIEHGECGTDSSIVLVGTADMNRVQQKMLDQVAGQFTAMVFAPEDLADRFDAHGCLRPEAWQEICVDLADGQIEIAGGPAEQASAAVRAIADLEGRYAADQVTIGVPDERLVPYLQQQFGQWDVSVRHGAGVPIEQTEPYRLLAAVADYLEAGDFRTLAALVRHPAVADWLAAQKAHDDWLTLLDRYWSEHLPHQLGRPWLGSAETGRRLQRLTVGIGRLTRDLGAVEGDRSMFSAQGASAKRPSSPKNGPVPARGPVPGRRRPLDQWCEPILNLLVQVFGEVARDARNPADHGVLTACGQLRDVLGEDLRIPAELMPAVSAGEALRLVLQQAAGGRIAPLSDPKAIELLGWLELPLDDAPALVVVAMNEGIVPSSLNADLFLPNQLRRVLGIEDNARRYARDAYALGVLCRSRERLRVIAGRRTSDGDPLVPSRLLFACDRPAMARRALAYFGPAADTGSASCRERPQWRSGGSEEAAPGVHPGTPQRAFPTDEAPFHVPRPRPLAEPVRSMRVTEFRDYLACPYRYYLRHRLRLERLADDAEELDGLGFGSLVHEVLRRFGGGPLAASTDARQINDFLGHSLDEVLDECYGRSPLPAIRVQAEQIRARLAAFADWQAAWAAEGWRIEHVEWQPEEGQARLMVDGQPMFLRGRIDRVDVHASDGRAVIFDYKSSNQAEPPEKTHRRQGQWVDLQLPLYRHLAAELRLGGPIELAYLVLPKDVRQVGPLRAEWTKDDLTAADAAAEDVVRKVRAEQFWPPASPPPAFFDDLAAICQDSRLIARIEKAAGEEEEQG
jgi:RecB family exonuclease